MGVYEIIENEVSGVCVWREVLWIDHGKRKVHKLLQLWREVLWIDHGKRKKGMCNHTLLDHALLLSHQADEHQSRAHSVEFPEHFRHKYIYLSETTLLTQMS
jgi:hypothetical protein